MGAQRAIEHRHDGSHATSRAVVMLCTWNAAALMSMVGHRNVRRERASRAREENVLPLEELFDTGHIGTHDCSFGDHQWLVPIADMVGVETPLLRRARLDQ